MHPSLDFYYQVTQALPPLDNSYTQHDENLMKIGRFFGFDNLVNEPTFFEIHSDNLRETATSTKSLCSNRIRQLVASLALQHGLTIDHSLEYILENFYKEKNILLLENNSPFASIMMFLCRKHKISLVTSEFFGDKHKSGDLVGSVLNLDIQSTHFQDNTFDLILHTDVFEHVPDALAGEREVARILRPGGSVIFTVPFSVTDNADLVYAAIENGKIKYYKEPIYHLDPIAPDGKCLVFRIFAFPTMKERFNQLGCDFHCNYMHSNYLGILGNNGYSFVGTKRRI